jgi:hypothetical protein
MEAIMRIVKKIAEGLFVIADSCVTERNYIYPTENDRSKDIANLSLDVRNVGNDMKKSITKYGERAYQFTSN